MKQGNQKLLGFLNLTQSIPRLNGGPIQNQAYRIGSSKTIEKGYIETN